MNKKLLLLVFAMLLFLSGCQKYDVINKTSPNYPPINPLPQKNRVDLTLYFPDSRFKSLKQETRTVEIYDTRIYELVINELINGPDSKALKKVISSNVRILSIDIIDDIIYVNLNSDAFSKNMREDEEAFALYSIVNSLIELEGINKVQILLDGELRDKLGSYYSISEPIEFSSLIVDQEYISPTQTIIQYYQSIIKDDYRSAFSKLYVANKKGVKVTTVESFFEGSYGDISEFRIKDYSIDGYGKNINLYMSFTLFTYDGLGRRDETRIFNLFFSEGEYKITNILD